MSPTPIIFNTIVIFLTPSYRCFQKIGCLITADGINNAKINLEVLKGYIVQSFLTVETETPEIECFTRAS